MRGVKPSAARRTRRLEGRRVEHKLVEVSDGWLKTRKSKDYEYEQVSAYEESSGEDIEGIPLESLSEVDGFS